MVTESSKNVSKPLTRNRDEYEHIGIWYIFLHGTGLNRMTISTLVTHKLIHWGQSQATPGRVGWYGVCLVVRSNTDPKTHKKHSTCQGPLTDSQSGLEPQQNASKPPRPETVKQTTSTYPGHMLQAT